MAEKAKTKTQVIDHLRNTIADLELKALRAKSSKIRDGIEQNITREREILLALETYGPIFAEIPVYLLPLLTATEIWNGRQKISCDEHKRLMDVEDIVTDAIKAAGIRHVEMEHLAEMEEAAQQEFQDGTVRFRNINDLIRFAMRRGISFGEPDDDDN